SSDLHCTWKRSTKSQGVLHAESSVTCASYRYARTCHKCGLTSGHLPDASAGLYFYWTDVPDPRNRFLCLRMTVIHIDEPRRHTTNVICATSAEKSLRFPC